MSELTARRGVAETQLAVNKIRWFFREQPISDQGVDAIVEDVHPEPSEVGTGRLLALQIKGGPSWFRRPSAEGWWFRFDAGHASRWLNLPIPVAVVLVDDEAGVCYWQEISPSTIIKAGKGFKVEVPKAQTVPDASQAWRDLASKAVAEAELLYENSIAHLPPPVGNGLKGLRPAHPADAALIAYHLAEGRNNAGGSVSALLAAEPTWLKRCAPRSWVIIGDYASAHDLNLYAAECYERACLASDEAEPDRGRWFSAAATQLVYSDRTRAAALVDEASSCGASPAVVAVLRAAIDHPEGDASAIPVPDFLDLEGETVRKSAFVQSFLAIQA
ncbi:MAG TPA: DUF4365 domain-containing protein, partial [Marmoricola sp.]|nr:DUF4365 domain-containing protein [Marmoricola sp.]